MTRAELKQKIATHEADDHKEERRQRSITRVIEAQVLAQLGKPRDLARITVGRGRPHSMGRTALRVDIWRNIGKAELAEHLQPSLNADDERRSAVKRWLEGVEITINKTAQLITDSFFCIVDPDGQIIEVRADHKGTPPREILGRYR